MPVSDLVSSDFRPMTHDKAAKFFAAKTVLTSDQFDKLTAANKARAFRIARVHNLRLLQDARDVVHRAIKEGTPYPEVRRALHDLFDRKGLPRPSLNHLRTMYRRNVIQAYNEARRETLSDPTTTKLFPYWQYLTVGNGRAGVNNVRPSHAALHGKIFAWNDPFWRHFMPPWDWGCRCFFRAMTAKQVARAKQPIWTHRAGAVVPDTSAIEALFAGAAALAAGLARRRGFKAKPGRGFDGEQFDMSGIDEELRRAAEGITG